ncbi:hypothetical protein BJ742DRAFT_814722 [Cladochytrium replicatum]|nr:hypothetical protein BJ742DRAFT_814722 [Cladochytrium replicatum]
MEHTPQLLEDRWGTSLVLSVKALLLWRACALLYCIITAVLYIAFGSGSWDYLTTFTNWSWTFLILYMGVALRCSWQELKSTEDVPNSYIVRFAIANAYAPPAVFHLAVPFVFWTLLAQDYFDSRHKAIDVFFQISFHVLDFIIIAIEAFVSRIPLSYSQWRLIVAILIIYLAWAYASHYLFSHLVDDADGYWPYPFLNPAYPWWWTYMFAIFVIFLLFHAATVTLHKLRDRVRGDTAMEYTTL